MNDMLTTNRLVEVYIKIREARKVLDNEFKSKDRELEDQIKVVESKLLDICKLEELDGLKTKAGTVTRMTKSRYWTSDWSSMYAFIRENEAFDLLEQRIHQTHMKQFLMENPDKLPIGLNSEHTYSITVRRAK